MTKAQYKKEIGFLRQLLHEAARAETADERARALDELATDALTLSNEIQEEA